MKNISKIEEAQDTNPAQSSWKQVGIDLATCAIEKAFGRARGICNFSLDQGRESVSAVTTLVRTNRLATVITLLTLGFIVYKIRKSSLATNK